MNFTHAFNNCANENGAAVLSGFNRGMYIYKGSIYLPTGGKN